MSANEALAFIEEDLARGQIRCRALAWIAALITLTLTMGLGLGLRDHKSEALGLRIFLPNLVSALVLAFVLTRAYLKRFSSKLLLDWAYPLLMLGLFLATERVFFPPASRTEYATWSNFWSQSARCFIKGGFASLLAGACLFLLAFSLSSLPARRWRFLLVAASGVAGATMLGFHCDSSSAGHVLTGHFLPGLVCAALLWLCGEYFFYRQLNSRTGGLLSRIQHPGRIG